MSFDKRMLLESSLFFEANDSKRENGGKRGVRLFATMEENTDALSE